MYRQSQTSGTERGITRGNGADDDADHCQGNADTAHGLGADVVDGGGLTFGQSSGQTGVQTTGDFVQRAARSQLSQKELDLETLNTEKEGE